MQTFFFQIKESYTIEVEVFQSLGQKIYISNKATNLNITEGPVIEIIKVNRVCLNYQTNSENVY
jgi:hypothetical protein